ncbi:Ig-like domain-containing protein, partial [Nibrella viscosa]|uniref:Ig-like domain-containing protein n=1 Tax=Nibrella viscosa TaxID=1084524 RepID=UPI0031F017AF
VNTSLCDTALVRINVGNAPAPVANADVVTGVLGQPVTIALLGNDLAGNGQPASLTNVTVPVVVSGPANGTAVVNPDGTLTYTPALGFAGSDTLVYRICSIISPSVCDTARVIINVPSAPPTANRDNGSTAFQQPVTLLVLGNDTDRAGRPASLSTVTLPLITRQPSNGTAVTNSTGTITYTPNAGFAGSDSLIYRICDRVNTSLCDTALLVVNVGSVAPVANRDNYTTAFNQPVQIPVLLNDQARGTLPASLTNVTAPSIVTQPVNGSLALNANGTITYTPNAGFAGADQFIYRICDQVNTGLCDTALVVVNVGSQAPVANPDVVAVAFNQPVTVNVLANDADRNGTVPATLATVTTPVILAQPASGTAVVNVNGSITFTPATGFAGSTTLVYQICDRVNTALCDTARVTFNVGSAPPVANPDSYTLGFNQTLALAVLVNDLSRTGAPASVSGVANVTLPTIVTQPTGGTVVVNTN